MPSLFDDEFDAMNQACLDLYGEKDAALLWPDTSIESELFGILEKSARPEQKTPGNVARFFVKQSDIDDLIREIVPRVDEISINSVYYLIIDVISDDGLGVDILIRKKS